MKKLVKLYYRIYIRWLAFRWMFQTNLGNRVWYKGELWNVSNGTSSGYWALNRIRDNARHEYALRAECRLQRKLSNYLHSYRSGVRFYTGYWLDIWAREGIQPWVRACSIWPGKRRNENRKTTDKL